MELHANCDGWQLPTSLQLRILWLLPPNERALSGRLAFRDAADAFSAAKDRTASLGQQLPPHAVPWALEAGQQHVRVLPFHHKFRLLNTAASSGSEVNLEVALTLLQQSIFPELLHSPHCSYYRRLRDPGVAAVKAGHPQLLGCLLSHCPGLLSPSDLLEAAAQYCDLAGLRAVWDTLRSWPADSGSSGSSSDLRANLSQYVLDAAAGSATPDAVAKMQWVLAASAGAHCRLNTSTAAAAARSRDLPRLRWLHEKGCQLVREDWDQYTCLLAEATMEVAQWLVDEAGCGLPRAVTGTGREHNFWEHFLYKVAQGRDGAAKLRWLQGRRPPQLQEDWEGDRRLLVRLVELAAGAGQPETVQSLITELQLLPDGKGARDVDPDYAAASGCVPMAAFLRDAGLRFSVGAYYDAATNGHLAMVRWLAQEAGVSAEGLNLVRIIEEWPEWMAAYSRDLLQAVQLLVGVAGCRGWVAELALSLAADRGDLALVQYLEGQLQQQQQQPAHQRQQEQQEGQQHGQQEGQGRGQQDQGQGQQGQRPPVAWPDGKTVRDAAEAGCEALLEWLVEQHPGCRVEGTSQGRASSAYLCAAKAADRGTLVALRRLGVPRGTEDVVVQAVKEGYKLPVVRWLVEQGAPVGRVKDMKEAVARRVRGGGLCSKEAAWLRGLAGAAEAAAAERQIPQQRTTRVSMLLGCSVG